MPWNSGVYTRGYASWTNDANANLPISATKFDTEDNDFASGLNNCLTIDGLNKPNTAITWGLSAAQVLALTRGGDGNVFSVARTGGTNNPALSASVTDATGVGLAASFGSLSLTTVSGSVSIASAGNVTIGAPSSGTALSVTGVASGVALSLGDGTETLRSQFDGSHNAQISVTGAHSLSLQTSGVTRLTLSSGGAAPSLQAWGPTAGALVDLTPDSGSFGPTWTGFSANPAQVIHWLKFGGLAILWPSNISTGTSNATTMTITNLPAVLQTAQSVTNWWATCYVIDNGTTKLGVATPQNNATMAFGVMTTGLPGAGGFTASGAKGIAMGPIIYPLAS